MKSMPVLKLPPFIPCRVGEGKRAAISKETCFSQKRDRSYFVLALIPFILNYRKMEFIRMYAHSLVISKEPQALTFMHIAYVWVSEIAFLSKRLGKSNLDNYRLIGTRQVPHNCLGFFQRMIHSLMSRKPSAKKEKHSTLHIRRCL